MSHQLILSTVLISLALVFYSLGVWSERIAIYLKPWHVVTFWIGFTFDVLGTWTMHKLAKGTFNLTSPHTLTGEIAILLMFIHAVWATFVIRKGSDELRTNFHRYSIIVWLIWLVPYFGGLYIGMSRPF